MDRIALSWLSESYVLYKVSQIVYLYRRYFYRIYVKENVYLIYFPYPI